MNRNFQIRKLVVRGKKSGALLTNLFRMHGKTLTTGVLFLLVYFLLQPFLHGLLTRLWVIPVISLFEPGWLFDLAFLIIAALAMYSLRQRRISAWDCLIIGIYFFLRFVNHDWIYKTIFFDSYGKRFSLWYLDSIGIYYLLLVVVQICQRKQKHRLTKNPPLPAPELLHTDMPLFMQSQQSGKTLEELDGEGLHRNKFAGEIARVMDRVLPYRAFAIGICGAWGSGKTSLISLIVHKLDQIEQRKLLSRKRGYAFIEFTPWFFSSSGSLINSFFGKLEEAFGDDFSLAAEIKSYGTMIAAMEKSFLKTEFSAAIFPDNPDLEKRYLQISERIRAKKKILVITIDDLDRLDRREIVDVFRLIRLVANFPKTFYLVGYDRSYIRSAIEEQLTTHEPDKYIDKVFNLEFKIPQTHPDIIRERLQKAIEKQASLLYGNYHRIKEPQLNKAIKFKTLDRVIRNERDILRFSNNLMIRHLSIRQDINFYQLFLLELIAYHQPELVGELFFHRELILAAHNRVINDAGNTNEQLQLKGIFENDLTKTQHEILTELFGRSSAREDFTIADDNYFIRYFSLSLQANEFSEKSFQDALQLPYQECGKQLKNFYAQNSRMLMDKLHLIHPLLQTADETQLNKMIRALLILYVEVFPSPNPEGLQRTNLGVFIVSSAHAAKQAPSYVTIRALETPAKDYAAFSFLFGAEFLRDQVAKSMRIDSTSFFMAYRDTQLKILSLEIEQVKGYSDRILEQVVTLYEFYKADTDPHNYLWHTNRVIDGNKDWFIHHRKKIFQWILRNALSDNLVNLDKLRSVFSKLFIDLGNEYYSGDDWKEYRLLNKGYECVNYQNSHLNFNDITGIPEYNDRRQREILKLGEGEGLSFTLTPSEFKLWRFGLKLYLTGSFPEQRYTDNYLMFELVKGAIDMDNKEKDNPDTGLEFAVHLGSKHINGAILLKEYDNEPIYFSLAKTFGELIFTFETKEGEVLDRRIFEGYADYNYVQVNAWADKRPFYLQVGISMLRRVTAKPYLINE